MKEQKEKIENEIKSIKKKYDRKELIALLGAVFFASFGTMLLFGLPINGLAMLCISLGLFKTRSDIPKRKELTVKRLEQEIAHLDKVEKEGINASNELNRRRKSKLASLSSAKTKSDKSLTTAKRTNTIALLGMGASAVVTTIFPIIGLAACALFSGLKAYTSFKINDKTETNEVLARRMNNINNDLNIIKELSRQPRKVTKQGEQPKKGKDKVEAAKKTNVSKNEGLVQQYIDMLQNQPKQPAKPLEKTKTSKY